MGLLDTFRRLARRLRGPPIHDAVGLRCTEEGTRRLAALPDDRALHLRTRPSAWGVDVLIDEGEASGARPLLGGRIVATDADLHALRGTVLDHDGQRWLVAADLEVHPVETPNPKSRLYRTNRILAQGSLYLTEAPAAPLPRHLLSDPRVVSLLLQAHQLSVERAPDVSWEELDALVHEALHAWATHGALPVTPEALHPTGSLEAAVWQVIEARVLPTLRKDGGDLRLLAVEDGVVKVELVGACAGCPASEITLRHGVEKTLREALPGRIERVEAV
jgi:Fe-S cluster biogenesis protein NfuA